MPRRLVDPLFIYGLAYLAFLYGPLLLLPVFSVNDSIYVAFPLSGFTWRWYGEMAGNAALHAALLNSIKVGVAVALASTALGLLAAKALTGRRFAGRTPVAGMIMLPLVVPGIIFGIALLILFRKIADVDLSLWSIGAAHLLICTPFATLTLISRLEGFDRSLEEASLNLGETAWATFWRVTFPLALPGILASLLLTFTISFDEIVLAFFVSGTEQTLPIYIFSQLRFPQRLPMVLALGTCVLAVSILLVTAAEWLRRGSIRGQNDSVQ